MSHPISTESAHLPDVGGCKEENDWLWQMEDPGWAEESSEPSGAWYTERERGRREVGVVGDCGRQVGEARRTSAEAGLRLGLVGRTTCSRGPGGGYNTSQASGWSAQSVKGYCAGPCRRGAG
eukprot:1195574-Prorocentrum_minimum.AAC.6